MKFRNARDLKGAFIIVSHNREFVSGLTQEAWHVGGGEVSVETMATADDMYTGAGNKRKRKTFARARAHAPMGGCAHARTSTHARSLVHAHALSNNDLKLESTGQSERRTATPPRTLTHSLTRHCTGRNYGLNYCDLELLLSHRRLQYTHSHAERRADVHAITRSTHP